MSKQKKHNTKNKQNKILLDKIKKQIKKLIDIKKKKNKDLNNKLKNNKNFKFIKNKGLEQNIKIKVDKKQTKQDKKQTKHDKKQTKHDKKQTKNDKKQTKNDKKQTKQDNQKLINFNEEKIIDNKSLNFENSLKEYKKKSNKLVILGNKKKIVRPIYIKKKKIENEKLSIMTKIPKLLKVANMIHDFFTSKDKLISYCIFGDCNLYNYGIWENAMLLPIIFPSWRMRVYYTDTCNMNVIKELKKLPYVECSLFLSDKAVKNTMIRFLPAYEEKNDIVIVRDADSRLNIRDRTAVEEWLKSDNNFHIMRDHPKNKSKILAGMWGVRNKLLVGRINDFFEWFDNPPNEKFSLDQQFLAKKIYPIVKHTSTIHASFNAYEDWAKPFPSKAPSRSKGFVGKTYYKCPYSEKKFELKKDIKIKKHRCI